MKFLKKFFNKFTNKDKKKKNILNIYDDNNQQDFSDISLINNDFNNIYTNISISYTNNKKNIEYISEFFDYSLIPKHNFIITIIETSKHKNKSNQNKYILIPNYYNKQELSNDFYLQCIKNINFINFNGILEINITNNNIIIDSIKFKYTVNNYKNYPNDIITIFTETSYFILHLEKNIKKNIYFINQIIYKNTI